MKRSLLLSLVLLMAVGCRSKDNAAGFDQAVEDIKKGVTPSKEVPSEEYQEGYREVIERLDAGLQQNEQHNADQKRAQQFHERRQRD